MKYYSLRTAAIILLFFGLHSQSQPPPGYYDETAGYEGQTLKTKLHQIIDNHTIVSYSSLWNYFQDSDAKPNGKVWDMYSDIPANPPYEYEFVVNQCGAGGTNHENQCYNREHSFPKSWFGGDVSPMYTDLHHIYPVDGYLNLIRFNYPYAETDSPSVITLNGSKRGPCTITGYTGTVFEPIDEYKGDLARTCFYIATRYENLVAGWNVNSMQAEAILNGTAFPVFESWYLDMLIAWHNADPVSQKELDRNNAVYNIQGNRNPFIDEPGFVQLIWSENFSEEPVSHAGNFSANTITLTWVDALGTHPPDGYLVRMSADSFSNIPVPENGIYVKDDFWNKNIAYGKQFCIFAGLISGTRYYFKLFSYRGKGAGIVYKTAGAVPHISIIAK